MSQPQTSPNSNEQPSTEELCADAFVCNGGLVIAGTVDIRQMVGYAKTAPDGQEIRKAMPKQNWHCLQVRLLYSARAKAVTAQKGRETVERRMVIEDDLE